MSYASRVYRQRNPHTHEEKSNDGFFGKIHDVGKTKPGNGFFQAKLDVNKPGDKYEKEADSVANAVVNNASANPKVQKQDISSLQKAPAEKEEKLPEKKPVEPEKEKEKLKGVQKKEEPKKEEEEPLQRQVEPNKEEEEKETGSNVQMKQNNGSGQAPDQVSRKMESTAGSGKSLPPKTLNEMGSAFGSDFSDVRIHNDPESASMNRELNAQAFTHGKDIYFNKGKYNPESASGKQLLAHELTHTIQQSGKNKTNTDPGTNIHRKKNEEKEERDLQSPRFKGDENLEKALDDTRHVKFGDTGDHVKKLQQAMIDTGIPMPISTKKSGSPDGIFLSETKEAVKSFQRNNGFEGRDVDGIVGPNTMELFDARFPGGTAATVPTTKKTVTVNITFLHGSKMVPSRALAFANTIYFNQANIEIKKGSEKTLGRSETEALIGKDLMLEEHFFDNFPSDEEKVLFKVNQSSDAIAMYFVKDITEDNGKLSKSAVAYAISAKNKMGFVGFAVGNRSGNTTFAHELGHVLGVELHTTDKDPKTQELLLMAPGAPGFRLTAEDIKTMRASKFAK